MYNVYSSYLFFYLMLWQHIPYAVNGIQCIPVKFQSSEKLNFRPIFGIFRIMSFRFACKPLVSLFWYVNFRFRFVSKRNEGTSYESHRGVFWEIFCLLDSAVRMTPRSILKIRISRRNLKRIWKYFNLFIRGL